MTKRGAILLDSQAVVKADPSSDISRDILTELNALIPTAARAAGWLAAARAA
jgi:hypothetical protein